MLCSLGSGAVRGERYGARVSLSITNRSVRARASGYSADVVDVMRGTLGTITSLEISQEDFALEKEKMWIELANLKHRTARDLGHDMLQQVV